MELELIRKELKQLSEEKILSPVVQAKIIEQGAEIVAGSPEEFRAFIKDETERLAAVIRGANIALD